MLYYFIIIIIYINLYIVIVVVVVVVVFYSIPLGLQNSKQPYTLTYSSLKSRTLNLHLTPTSLYIKNLICST